MKYCMRGGLIKGKEIAPGNSPKNDIYDVKLSGGRVIKGSAGEIVLDKETLAKNPQEWIMFIQNEMKKSPDLFKNHFFSGGQAQPYTNNPSNQLYQVGSDAPAAAPAPNIVKPPSERVRQIEAVRDNLGKSAFTPALQQEYSALKAQGYSSGGLVSAAGLSNNYANGGMVKENEHPMAEGGEVNNSLTPDNAFNHYLEGDGILGGTVYDGSTDEKFLFGPYCFDIDKARMISGKKANGQIPVSPLWLDKVRLNPEDAQKSKSKNPVFVAQIQTPNGLKPLLIDGNHRMYKAVHLDEKSLDAYIFSPQETASLMVAKPDDVEHPKDEGKEKFFSGGTPSPGFDPDKFLTDTAHADFNPDEFLKKTAPLETSMSDKAQTALEQFGNATTMGYLPQIQSATAPAVNKAMDLILGEKSEPSTYVQRRDENIKRMAEEQERNPKSALAGQAAGVLAGAAMTPGMGGASGLVGSVAKGTALGAAYGAVQNPGDTQGKVDPLQLEQRGENAVTGAEFGAAAGAAGSLIGKGINAGKNSADAAQQFANAQAVKAGGGMLKDFRQLSSKGRLDEMGQFALDNGIVKAGDTVKDVAKKADSFRQNAGEQLDEVYKKAKSSAVNVDGVTTEFNGFNPSQAKEEILSAVSDKLGDSPNKAKAMSTVRKYMGQLERDYGDQVIDPKKANDIKTAVDKEINYARSPLTKNPAAEEGYSVLRNYINDAVKSHVEQVGAASGDPELAQKLLEANKNYGNAKQFQSMAEDRIARENANKMLGLTDTIAGTGGAAIGYAAGEHHNGHGLEGAAAGFMAGMAHKTVGKYAPAAMASMANKASPILGRTVVPISEFLARSPKDLATKAMLQEFMLNRKGDK